MPFSDEEQEVPCAELSGAAGRKLLGNGEKLVRLVAYGSKEAPLEANRQQVMLELTDTSSAGYRSGLDLVAVLDVSGSMAGQKLDDTKTAMQFIIKKLSPIDRLSIVTFSDTAKKECSLRFMTEDRKAELERRVSELKDDSLTNITHGLQTGLQVLDGRRLSAGRVASIILMSDGEHTRRTSSVPPEKVDVGNVAVYTFGFGDKHNPMVLDEIARKSQGGTYNYVKGGAALSVPFSQILGGLLSVVVRDLKLTVTTQHPDDSKIQKVDPGRYRQTEDVAAGGSFTVSFGDLYSREVRKVMVDLLLPEVAWEYVATTIIARCSYSIQGKLYLTPPLRHSIRRTRSAAGADAKMPTEVKTEQARRDHADLIGKVSTMDHVSARDKLEAGRKALDDLEESNPMIDILKNEEEQLQRLTESPNLYEDQGRPYARACKTSHEVQRPASTGDVQDVRPFKTPLMDKYVEQAKKFQEDPTMPLPSLEDDLKDEEEPAPPMPVPWVETERVKERPVGEPRIWWGGSPRHQHRTSRRKWLMVILCTVLAIVVVVTIAAMLSVYLVYKPSTPYLAVSDAQLGRFQYGQDGTIQYVQVSITILANNNNSKADASFSRFDLALGLHGAEVALLRSLPFVVPRQSSLPLQFNVVSAGRALDPAGKRDMDESLKAGLVPLDLSGKVRTRWKVGIFLKRQFWTRISCRLLFFFPGNGTVVMPTGRHRCRSRSP